MTDKKTGCCHTKPTQEKQSSCSSQAEEPSTPQSSCCAKKTETPSTEPLKTSCCGGSSGSKGESGKNEHTSSTSSCCDKDPEQADWFLRICLALCIVFYGIALSSPDHQTWYGTISHSVQELLNTMWWSVLLAIFFVGLLSKIPQHFVTSVLGKGGTMKGLWRATFAGVLLDLCNHGILMVGMELRKKGASLGQVMAFLIASPWNSLSLTLIMIALIGWQWTIAFILLSMLIAIIAGWIFDRLEQNGQLPSNQNQVDLPEDFHFWNEAKASISSVTWDKTLGKEIISGGLEGSKMVIRWLLFGVLLASAIRGFVSLEDFQSYFGPTLLGLGATLIAATIIEVCSEGSTPIAADLMNRANAPGNSFAFLMAGAATDYTEVMVIKDTTKSWKTALFLPLLTVPQVIIIAILLNNL